MRPEPGGARTWHRRAERAQLAGAAPAQQLPAHGPAFDDALPPFFFAGVRPREEGRQHHRRRAQADPGASRRVVLPPQLPQPQPQPLSCGRGCFSCLWL